MSQSSRLLDVVAAVGADVKTLMETKIDKPNDVPIGGTAGTYSNYGLQVGGRAAVSATATLGAEQMMAASNLYYDGTNWRFVAGAGTAKGIVLQLVEATGLTLSVASAGTADALAGLGALFTVNQNGQLQVGGRSANPVGTAPLLVKAVASQTANLIALQNSAGATTYSINASGQPSAFSGGNFQNGGAVSTIPLQIIGAGNVGVITLVVKGVASQTAPLISFQNSAAAQIATVDATGGANFAGYNYISDNSIYAMEQGSNPNNQLKAGAASHVVLVLQGVASQSAAIQQWKNSAGTVLASVNNVGTFFANVGASISNVSATTFVPLTVTGSGGTGVVTAVLKAVGSQTADILQSQNSAGTVLRAITAAGLPKWADASTVQTTVGAAGAASALPATPTKYLKVVDNAGTTLVIPAYAAS